MTERIEDERRLMGTMVRLCAEKLEQRRHHGRWVDEVWSELSERVDEEHSELDHELISLEHAEVHGNPGNVSIRRERAIGECVDVALTAMMLADKLLLEGVE